MTAPEYEGRLELTWTNKNRRLLSHEDGSYEWTDSGDHRVAEVRLLHDVTAVGDTRGKRDRAKDNLLIRGDALHALTSLAKLPEFRDEYVGKVKLCYIDPPFNTGQAFAQYDDALEHSVWLTMMRDRLVQVHELLSPDGSVWVHLDDNELHYCKALMDEIFGRSNFAGTIVWEKITSGRNDQRLFSVDQDYILVYAKDAELFAPNQDPHTEAADKAYRNPDNDPRGPWREVDYKGPKSAAERPNLYYPIVNPFTGVEVWPRQDAVWRYSREEHERLVREDRLWWGKTGNYSFPKRKKFLSERKAEGTPPRTLWRGEDVDTTRRAKAEIKLLFPDVAPFPTPKPERLLHRIIRLATEPGDVVLDCFAGSGTTAAVAHKMRRRWVTAEWSRDTVERFTFPRLTKVVGADDSGGVTAETAWEGGGGFRVLDVAASMFAVHDARVVLADWAVDGALGEAVAAQVGFAYAPDPPFTGTKGRTRLAVIDGLVDDAVVTMLASWLPDGELLTVYGTAVDPESAATLRSIRRGCTVRKIPQSVLDEYRRRGRSDGLNWPSAAPSNGHAEHGVPMAAVTT